MKHDKRIVPQTLTANSVLGIGNLASGARLQFTVDELEAMAKALLVVDGSSPRLLRYWLMEQASLQRQSDELAINDLGTQRPGRS